MHRPQPVGAPPAQLSSAVTNGSSHRRPEQVLCISELFLRTAASIFSAVAVPLVWVAPSQPNGETCQHCYPSSLYRYCGAVAIIVCVYYALQLLKGIYEGVKEVFLAKGRATHYTNFVLDQVMAYLSTSSFSILALMANGKVNAPISDACRKTATSAAVFSVCASFFLAASALSSAWRLCTPIAQRISAAHVCKFIFDQVCAYLLVSCSSLLISAAKNRLGSIPNNPCGYATVAPSAAALSFCCFVYVAARACIEGHRACEL